MCTAEQSTHPSSLAADALRRVLRDLAGNERRVQVDFLLHLDEFDRRRGYVEAGYDSLWTYCLRELHLREGPAARRIGAMRALRRHPGLEAPLRDGRLCLSTVTVIAPLLADNDLDAIVARAAYLTKAEVEHLAASLRPSVAPRDGLRQLGASRVSSSSPSRPGSPVNTAAPPPNTASNVINAEPAGWPGISPTAAGCRDARGTTTAFRALITVGPTTVEETPREPPVPSANHPAADEEPSPRGTTELRAVSGDRWSLRVTLDTGMKADLEMLRSLLSHSTGGDLRAVLREALRCGVEKHGKRRGAVAPERPRRATGRGGPKTQAVVPRGSSRDRAPSPLLALRGRTSDEPPGVTSTARDGTKPRVTALPGATPDARSADAVAVTSRACDVPNARVAPPGAAPDATSADAPAVTPSAYGGPNVRVTAPPGAAPDGRTTEPSNRERCTTATAAESRPAASNSRFIPAAVRREVWRRDDSCCSWTTTEGVRCGSRWKLELDHITPVARGGTSTVDNLRLVCRAHNLLHADQVFGRAYMERFSARGSGHRGIDMARADPSS